MRTDDGGECRVSKALSAALANLAEELHFCRVTYVRRRVFHIECNLTSAPSLHVLICYK